MWVWVHFNPLKKQYSSKFQIYWPRENNGRNFQRMPNKICIYDKNYYMYMHNVEAKFVYTTLYYSTSNRQFILNWKTVSHWYKWITEWSNFVMICRMYCRGVFVLKTLWYKYSHRFIATNINLYKMKYKDSKLCTLYNLNDESIEYLVLNAHYLFIWGSLCKYCNKDKW